MIIQHTTEHDGDSYLSYSAEEHEFRCICDRIVPKRRRCWCEICMKGFCSDCGDSNYKGTGWFVCNNCLENPDLIIEIL